MRVPIIRGMMDRRILVNYRVDPDVLARVLPAPFRPQRFHDMGIAGICLIRLAGIRPRFLPPLFGVSSENAAHRIAVQWEQQGTLHSGVYIPRRDTSSRLNCLVGGRLFPGVHHHARFVVDERDDYYRVELNSDDGQTHVLIEGRPTPHWPTSSVFPSLQAASNFFHAGSLGHSDSHIRGEFDGLELRTLDWHCQPLAVSRAESSYFDDRERFPTGTCQFDCALLMRGIEHEWCEQPMLCCEAAAT